MTNLNSNDLIKGWDRNTIASKIADDLPHSSYVNLGIGMPELVSQYIKEDREIIQDLIIAAHNDAKNKLKSKTSEEISKATGGLGVPGFKWPL